MSPPPTRPFLHTALAMLVTVVCIVVLTALLTAAVSSSSADDRLGDALTRIERLTTKAEAVQANQKALQARLDRRDRETQQARKAAVERDAELRRRLWVLTVFLRQQGFKIPEPSSAKSGSETRPKVLRPPTSRGNPTPTAPSPSTPTSPYCQLVPALCVGLPVRLPKL